MYLVDYHAHTRCSFDSRASLLDEAARAVELGLRELCTTDHCDLLDEDGQRAYGLDWAPILEQYAAARAAYAGKLTLRLGLELGGAPVDPACARSILAGAEPDFVLGSIHNLSPARGGTDLYYLDFSSRERCCAALDDYFDSLSALALLADCYDVLAHVIYPLRYMNPSDGPVTLDRYEGRLRELFKTAAQAGRGIELNTCRGQTLSEWAPILALYRDCGGEIVTVGSDAHKAKDVGAGIREAGELLKAAGFRYLAVYRRRIPQFVRL